MDIITILYAWLKKLVIAFHNSTLGGLFISVLIWISSIFTPIYLNIIFIFSIIILDVLLGIMASLKKGEAFTSHRLKEGLIHKVAFYGILLSSFLGFEYVLMNMFFYKTFYIIGAITAMIGFYELTSIIEKMIIIEPRIKVFHRILKFIKKTDEKVELKMEEGLDKVLGKDLEKSDVQN